MNSIAPPDARYNTRNTNLAACIGALRVPIKTSQPITIVRDHDSSKRIVSYWFEDMGAEPFCGEVHEPRKLERFWNNRESFEKEFPFHPLVNMRLALEKRDWLNHAWHGRIHPSVSMDKAKFSTTDIMLAATIMALGFPLLRLDKPRYLFRSIPRWVTDDYNNFQIEGFKERPAAIMHRALEARKILVKLARHPDLETQMRFTDGICDADGGKVAFISEKATDEQIVRTLDQLHKI